MSWLAAVLAGDHLPDTYLVYNTCPAWDVLVFVLILMVFVLVLMFVLVMVGG